MTIYDIIIKVSPQLEAEHPELVGLTYVVLATTYATFMAEQLKRYFAAVMNEEIQIKERVDDLISTDQIGVLTDD